MIEIDVNGVKHTPSDFAALEAVLASVHHKHDLEIWASFHEGATLCALINAHCGWLMFLRFPGDVGFSSRNPAADADDAATEIFVLNNRQADTYPKTWTLDRATVFAAISRFALAGDMASNLLWHDDCAD